MIVKSHPLDPARLAVLLDDGVTPEEYLEDMRENPELYYPDHLDACRHLRVLPMSRIQWRFGCLGSRTST
jgi:hypothetical protein